MMRLNKPALILSIALACLSYQVNAESLSPTTVSQTLIDKVNTLVDQDTDALIARFKDLHQHPELGFYETRTAAIVSAQLKELGFTVTEGIGKTGVVGVLKNGAGPTVWYRADMDANAVRETTGLPYAATTKQRLTDGSEVDAMHACGHDAHITWLLGMAKTMVALKSEWSGTLVVYAQPAEELGLGAQAMVDDGLWKRDFPKPDYAFGAHTAPGPIGVIASSPGVRMAGVDQLDIQFHGHGGHGSTPQLALDPIVMSAQAILAYQTIISRTLDPQSAAVITVGAVEAGRDNNVIPNEATLKLNLRWFDTTVRNQMIKRIDEINKGIAIAAGVSEDKMPTREMKGTASPLVNNAQLVQKINPSLELLMGKNKVIDQFPAVMGSEDFQEAFKDLNVPYVFMLIGVAPVDLFNQAQKEGKAFPYSNHNPDFFVDLAAIPIGAKVNTVAALSILAK